MEKDFAMFNRFPVSFLKAAASAILFVGIVNAQDVVTLKPVQVTATTSDHVIVSVPADYLQAARLQRQYASIGEADYVTDLSRAQVCAVLKKHPPSQDCTKSNYPASPGIRSASGAAWAGNGCGAGPMSSAFASVVLKGMHFSTYSGDLNKPVKGNPSIDFTAICNIHDQGYTSVGTKERADSSFDLQLKSLCAAAGSDGSLCQSFANNYVYAVKNLGNSAYEEDQKQLACSAWGDSMKKSGCA
ncbi:MAG: hypothetical protein IE913_04995 [Halothiobacillus sp.]|nr:hypothetical protein [Halothiobacillus sp.]